MKEKEKAVNKEAFTEKGPPAKVGAAEKPRRGRKPKEKQEPAAGPEQAAGEGNAMETDRTPESGPVIPEPPAEAEAHDAYESWEKTENGTYSDVRAETPAEPELEGKPENTEESGPVTGTVDDTEPDARLEPEQEPETESEDKPETEPVPKPETESVAITERNPVSHGPVDKPASIAPVQVVESPLRRMKQEFRERSQIIKEQMLNIQNAFITIGFQLHWIRNNNMYRVLNYKNVYEYAEKEYGIKKTTCCNFISIIENYAKRDASGEVIESIDDCYRNYSASQLVAMLGMPDEMKQQVTPDMSVRAINRMRRGEEEKPVTEPAAAPVTISIAEPAASKTDVPEKDAGRTVAEMPQPEDTGHNTMEEEPPEAEEAAVKVEPPETEEAAVEDATPETERDNGETTRAVTEGTPEGNNTAGTVGTLVEIDSYTVYQSIADKIDAMIRHVFSANAAVKVRIVCEQG